MTTQNTVKTDTVPFDIALGHLKRGAFLSRSGWNGKGMRIEFRPRTATLGPHFVILNVRKEYDTWVPSISDLLADDWTYVYPPEKHATSVKVGKSLKSLGMKLINSTSK